MRSANTANTLNRQNMPKYLQPGIHIHMTRICYLLEIFFGCNIEGINFCVVFLNISIIYISTPHPGTAPSIRREVPSFTPSVPILLAKLAPPHQRGRIIAVDAGEAQPKKRWTVGLMKWMDSKWFCLVLFTLW